MVNIPSASRPFTIPGALIKLDPPSRPAILVVILDDGIAVDSLVFREQSVLAGVKGGLIKKKKK